MKFTRTFLIAPCVVSAIPAMAQQSEGDALFGRYQRPEETIEAVRDREIDVLETVLRFYRPSGSQSRWIDRERLPASPSVAAAVLDAATVDELIRRLGRGRFCASDARDVCRSDYGGRLRISPVYRMDDDHARVVVDFESVWPHGPPMLSTQVFVLRHEGRKWRIERRGTAAHVDS